MGKKDVPVHKHRGIVKAEPPVIILPSIVGATATPSSLPYGGGDVVIDATLVNANSFTIDGVAATLPATKSVAVSHTFTLAATNTWGTTTVNLGVSVAEVSPPLGSGNWAERIQARGVFKAYKLDNAFDLGVNHGTASSPPPYNVAPYLGFTAADDHGYAPGYDTTPALDLAMGALVFTDVQGSQPNGAGKWQTRLDSSGSMVLRSNSHLWVQFKFRHDGIAAPNAPGIDSPGLHLFSIGGENAGYVGETLAVFALNTYWLTGKIFPYIYKNGVGIMGLDPNGLSANDPGAFSNGFVIPSDTDVWFQFHLHLGDYVSSTTVDMEFEGWYTINGVTTKVFQWLKTDSAYIPADCDPNHTTGPGISRVMFDTRINEIQGAHATPYHTWISELILSDQRIPDPTVDAWPAWRQGLTVGVPYEIQGTAYLSHILENTNSTPRESYALDVWNGLAAHGNCFYAGATSGHSIWANPTFKIDLNTENPTWELLDEGDAGTDWNVPTPDAGDIAMGLRYYPSGKPASRHTYNSQQVIGPEHDKDGKLRLMIFGANNTYAKDGWKYGGAGYPPGYFYGGGPHIESFRVDDRQWDNTYWPDITMGVCPDLYTNEDYWIRSTAKNPLNGDVYMSGSYVYHRFNAATGTTTFLASRGLGTGMVNPAYPNYVDWRFTASLVDPERNRFCCLTNQGANYGSGLRIEIFNIATNATDTPLPITGDLALSGPNMIFGFSGQGSFFHARDVDKYYCVNFPLAHGVVQVPESPENRVTYDNAGDPPALYGQPTGADTLPMKVYEIDPDTGVSTFVCNIPETHFENGVLQSYGFFNRAAYFEELGGIAFLARYSANIWFVPLR